MTILALALILISAVCHATWNLLLKRTPGGLPLLWLFDTVAVVVYAPVVAAALLWRQPELDPGALWIVAVSAVLHFAYFLSLQQGYRVGDLSLVYPLARGTGPVLALAAAVLLLGERPSGLALAGAVLIIGSVFFLTGGTALLMGRLAGRALPAAGPAIFFGLLTGLLIASYTLFDKVAVGVLLLPPLFYNWLANLGRALLMTPLVAGRRQEVAREWRTHRREVLGIAILSPLAYILVLVALVFTPVSYVAPAREISILLATVMGARLLSEGDARRRLVAAAFMVLGVTLLALG